MSLQRIRIDPHSSPDAGTKEIKLFRGAKRTHRSGSDKAKKTPATGVSGPILPTPLECMAAMNQKVNACTIVHD